MFNFDVLQWIVIVLSWFGWYAVSKMFKNEVKEQYEEELEQLRRENLILCENNRKLIEELLEITREKEQK